MKAIITEMTEAVMGMIEAAKESGTIAQRQASATEESAAAIAELRQVAHDLKQTAARL